MSQNPVTLSAEALARIDAEVAAGRFASREALLEKALVFYRRELEAARAFISPALADAAAGRTRPAREVVRELLAELDAETGAE
ncbi:MAG: type II toxin-antitoxin system ParD family antitoxin [Hydrogenophilaceae bacterium]|jgi:predicted transcriptional regulator|nr:type II toxin-antitoxin system ParD family antitoxin [Hydrogenophilaceae bacterium]